MTFCLKSRIKNWTQQSGRQGRRTQAGTERCKDWHCLKAECWAVLITMVAQLQSTSRQRRTILHFLWPSRQGDAVNCYSLHSLPRQVCLSSIKYSIWPLAGTAWCLSPVPCIHRRFESTSVILIAWIWFKHTHKVHEGMCLSFAGPNPRSAPLWRQSHMKKCENEEKAWRDGL